jgi:hypothetical protein
MLCELPCACSLAVRLLVFVTDLPTCRAAVENACYAEPCVHQWGDWHGASNPFVLHGLSFQVPVVLVFCVLSGDEACRSFATHASRALLSSVVSLL